MKKVVKIGKFEKLIYTFAFLLLISSPFAIVFLQGTLSKVNVEVEQIKKQIKTQEKKNESLVMQVNELTAFDKVKDVVAAMGLGYNNENIIVVSEQASD